MKRKPGHPDLDLCDLRNQIVTGILWCVEGEKAGLQTALNLVNERIKYNKLNREREGWDKK